jgi:2-polyprenyl-3-methyl-5-hydroxy-6-metoxy-1,4-benzoquinol methylase
MARSEEVSERWTFRTTSAQDVTDEDAREGWDNVAAWWVARYTPRGDVNREWIIDPVLLDFLGPVGGLRILDAGCGGGYLARLLARRGAAVEGVDLSPKLLAAAEAEEAREPLGVRYRQANLADLSCFPDETFDAAVANVVLQDVVRYREAVREIHRVLKPGGRFVFSTTHPAFEAPVPGMWVREPKDSERVEERRHLAVDRYFERVAIYWAPRGKAPAVGFHRPLRDYFEALHDAGFLVARLEEPTPSEEALERHYRHFADMLRVPLFLVVEAVKPPGTKAAG